MGPIRGLTAVFALLGLAVSAACSSDRAITEHVSGEDTNATTSPPQPDALRIQAYLDSRYKLSEVRHTFNTIFGETIDCIDFFAQPGAKALASRGQPLNALPKPPPLPRQNKGVAPAVDYTFNGAPDEHGNSRACQEGTVPLLRVTADDILRRGGLDEYLLGLHQKGGGGRPRRDTRAAFHAGNTTATRSIPSSAPSPRPFLASPPSTPGSCGQQFPQGDLYNVPLAEAYAHVQESVYLGATPNITEGNAQFAVYTPNNVSSTLATMTGSHDDLQVWMYGGWGFNGFGCSCGGTGEPPCTQSVETGWDIDPTDGIWTTNLNVPHFFTYSTYSGYSLTGSCYDGEASFYYGGYEYPCPTFIMNSASPMTPGQTISSNTVSGGPLYELYVEVEAGNGLDGCTDCGGWWVYAYQTTTAEMSGTGGWVGYYPFSDYNASGTTPMSSGTANEFQTGGEVSDPGDTTGLGWTIPMGSGKPPSAGYSGSAAYIINVNACAGSTCYYPNSVGPVTIPSNYGYTSNSSIPEPSEGTWGSANFFFVGGPSAPSQYSWTPYQTWQNNDPTLFVVGTDPPNVGSNAVPIAPVYVYSSSLQENVLQISVLTGAASGPYNHHLKQYTSSSGAWAALTDTSGNAVYLWGITSDIANGALWGWNYSDALYTNDTSEGLSGSYFGSFTANSVAASAPNNIVSTSPSSGTCTSDSPAGYCMEYYSGTVPTGSWGAVGDGAEEVVFDSAPLCTTSSCPVTREYALDKAGVTVGNIWSQETVYPFSWYQITDDVCTGSGGGTHQFVAMAVKNNVVFALGQSGTVWVYNSPAYPSGCWSKIANPSGKTFLSIAAYNASMNSIWASDTSGNLWTAN